MSATLLALLARSLDRSCSGHLLLESRRQDAAAIERCKVLLTREVVFALVFALIDPAVLVETFSSSINNCWKTTVDAMVTKAAFSREVVIPISHDTQFR